MLSILCTTVIPTIGRPTLARAVCSVLDQTLGNGDFEIVVVNDSGRHLPTGDWASSPAVRIIDSGRQERAVARNRGAAVARGRFLHFLDDDDRILPGALSAFERLSGTADSAAWLAGGYSTVDTLGTPIAEFRPDWNGDPLAWVLAGESIPLQASFLRADVFHAVGGFDTAFVGVEDRDLERRMAPTVTIASVSDLVAEIRVGRDSSTTNWNTLAAKDRLSRENMLTSTTIHARLRTAALSAYWRGRIARAYAGSAALNARRGRVSLTARRLMDLSRLPPHLGLSHEFWRGLLGLR